MSFDPPLPLDFARPEDREALMALHRKVGPNAFYCDPASPLNVATIVARRDDGSIRAAVSGRKTVEAFLEVDPDSGSPTERWRTARMLLDIGFDTLRRCGLGEVHLHTHDPRFAYRMSKLPGCFVGAPYHGFFLIGGV